MYNRLLCYVDASEVRLDDLEGVLDLASQLQCRLIVLSVIPPKKEGGTEKEQEKYDQLEDRVWNFLYQIEEEAFSRELKVSLMLEEGTPVDVVASVVKSYEADLCAIFFSRQVEPQDLANKLGKVPVLLYNQEGR